MNYPLPIQHSSSGKARARHAPTACLTYLLVYTDAMQCSIYEHFYNYVLILKYTSTTRQGLQTNGF